MPVFPLVANCSEGFGRYTPEGVLGDWLLFTGNHRMEEVSVGKVVPVSKRWTCDCGALLLPKYISRIISTLGALLLRNHVPEEKEGVARCPMPAGDHGRTCLKMTAGFPLGALAAEWRPENEIVDHVGPGRARMALDACGQLNGGCNETDIAGPGLQWRSCAWRMLSRGTFTETVAVT
ncbi:hypothetical protein NDU88_003425 [Pleurodeles waltl]|uniref:Uncharacterized protein n=1 Tax=Pleurodeles waltl TaxID=8319 RepID=A0AAV7SDL2_PLEWA|nr:hypothetical protein NDU88_003425 [Pleurodeles waltl]